MNYEFIPKDCNICGSNERVFLGKRIPRACALDKSLITNIAKCKKCGLIYPYPTPFAKKTQLEKNYGDPDEYFPTVISKERLRFYEGLMKEIDRINNGKKGKLLDIGCGRGEFLSVAKSKGWEVCGVEISSTFADYARKRFSVEVKAGNITEMNLPSNSFDAVSLIAVIQHTYDPRSIIMETNRVLKKGGIIFMETMNNESILYKLGDLYYRLMGKKYTTNLSPTFPCFQVYGFSARSMSYLLRDCGFKVVYTKIKGGISRTERVVIKGIKERLLRLIRVLCCILADFFNKGQVLLISAQKEKDISIK